MEPLLSTLSDNCTLHCIIMCSRCWGQSFCHILGVKWAMSQTLINWKLHLRQTYTHKAVKNPRHPPTTITIKKDPLVVIEEALFWPTSECQYGEVISKLIYHCKGRIILREGGKQFLCVCVWSTETGREAERENGRGREGDRKQSNL